MSGKLRKGPELILFNKYLSRSEKIGKLINFSSIYTLEYDNLKWARFLTELGSSKIFPADSHKVLLDERGQNLSSKTFANTLRAHRDGGTSEFIFFIGGADGVSANHGNNFDEKISFGKTYLIMRILQLLTMNKLETHQTSY